MGLRAAWAASLPSTFLTLEDEPLSDVAEGATPCEMNSLRLHTLPGGVVAEPRDGQIFRVFLSLVLLLRQLFPNQRWLVSVPVHRRLFFIVRSWLSKPQVFQMLENDASLLLWNP